MNHHVRFTSDTSSASAIRDRRFRTRVAGVVLAAAAAVSVGACSSGGTDNAGSQTASASAVVDGRNAADVSFSRDMIPHHQQAVEMAALAPSRASDPRVTELAAQIEAAQAPEIDELTTRLRSWGEAAPSASDASDPEMDHGSMDHGQSDGSMSGMMSADDLSDLADLRGADFDRMWLTMMIEHHTGAVAMARTEIAKGADAASKTLAQNIISTQQAEIARMRTMLAG